MIPDYAGDMQVSSTTSTVAARQAADRAAACRVRLGELAERRRSSSEDVRRAQAALRRAITRAANAQERLSQHRPREAPAALLVDADMAGTPTPSPESTAADVAILREQAQRLDAAQLMLQYFSLGGRCSGFELDAFVHAALELPNGEVAVLSQAVWEMTEL